MVKEVGQLQGPFEFLEEELDVPAAAVGVGDGLGVGERVLGWEGDASRCYNDPERSRNASQTIESVCYN